MKAGNFLRHHHSKFEGTPTVCIVTYSDIMIQFFDAIGQENTANKTVKPAEATAGNPCQQQEQNQILTNICRRIIRLLLWFMERRSLVRCL